MLYIGSDHRGYDLKEELKKYLDEKEISFVDCGTDSKEITHYPILAKRVASSVQESSDNNGILICATGVGMNIVANKFKGIRAGICFDEEMAKEAKAHDDINVLVLPADFVNVSKAVAIVRAWIGTEALGGRYKDRIKMINEIENDNMK